MPGRNFLFIPGPTNVPERILNAMHISQEDMRSIDFPAFTLPLFRDLKKVFKRKGPGVPFSRLGHGRLGGGDYQHAVARRQGADRRVRPVLASVGRSVPAARLIVDAIDVEWGEGVPLEICEARLKADPQHEIKAVLVCHNETATGVTSDVAGGAQGPRCGKASGAADGGRRQLDRQHRLPHGRVGRRSRRVGLAEGLHAADRAGHRRVSQKALAAHKSAKCPRCFFDFADMIRTNEDGFFPYTPATTMLRGLRASVDMLLDEGLDNVFARHRRLAEAARRAVAAWGLKLCAKAPNGTPIR